MKNQTRKRSSQQWVGTAIDHVDKRTLPGHRRDRRGQRKKGRRRCLQRLERAKRSDGLRYILFHPAAQSSRYTVKPAPRVIAPIEQHRPHGGLWRYTSIPSLWPNAALGIPQRHTAPVRLEACGSCQRGSGPHVPPPLSGQPLP
ncbi:Hypothetical Protein RRSL_02887 [Ralstonia solanacearum UW551]|uniref:Uncharacterized protein n=2 Tax=Ralstonia solanacearum TaxID=305 RepID=A0ABF7RG92_RALSL|nr:Hypothetical Protein RRSL_02887 [Ralstonia solanacearum UW551]CEJ20650.1 hypothetical protein RSIPO_04945 [Ralstonia solanacearum IPO1609]